MDQTQFEKPRWSRDLDRFLPLKSQFVLSGNVRDLQVVEFAPGVLAPVGLNQALASQLEASGYRHLIVFNPVTGFSVMPMDADGLDLLGDLMGEQPTTQPSGTTPPAPSTPAASVPTLAAALDALGDMLDSLARRTDAPVALLVDFASRLSVRSDNLLDPEHRLFLRALVHSQQARPRPWGEQDLPFYNTVLWVVEREGDLPDWFLIGNPQVRHIPIARPDAPTRRRLAPSLLEGMTGDQAPEAAPLEVVVTQFVDATNDMLLSDMKAITLLGAAEGVAVEAIADAVRRYKIGVTEDPWRRLDRSRIGAQGETFIRDRIKGQQHAVTHALDILKRAVTGVGGSGRGGRPRGVLFLAGPPGVGKTELAKTLPARLFGDPGAMIRFDMSEFSAEHADQRLLGAPPGYVGYDAGGELTNAIRERPFSLVLFDEIEKAHPRILDKFLQVLDDGVLTSGRGERVYFSEALIVFTSNLGLFRVDASGERVPNVTVDDPFETVRERVTHEIEQHFKLVLNRPEILNRIGENVIVFDFIRPAVGTQIFEQILASALDSVRAQDIIVDIDDAPKQLLADTCLADLSNGGRGIRNQIEAHLLNPLARELFDIGAVAGSRYRISAIDAGEVTRLQLDKLDGDAA
jgi:hypothetical protein